MRVSRPRIISSFVAAGLFVLAAMAGDTADAVTKLHDPVAGHETDVFGATNGQGVNRGPWVAQIAAAKDEYLYVTIGSDSGGAPTLFGIAGDGKIYFGYTHSGGAADLCIIVPVTGWMTFHVDIAGEAEQRISFTYNRSSCLNVAAPH